MFNKNILLLNLLQLQMVSAVISSISHWLFRTVLTAEHLPLFLLMWPPSVNLSYFVLILHNDVVVIMFAANNSYSFKLQELEHDKCVVSLEQPILHAESIVS